MAPALCDSLVIKAGTITARAYVTISSGTMPATPNITAVIRYGATTIITLTNAAYGGNADTTGQVHCLLMYTFLLVRQFHSVTTAGQV